MATISPSPTSSATPPPPSTGVSSPIAQPDANPPDPSILSPPPLPPNALPPTDSDTPVTPPPSPPPPPPPQPPPVGSSPPPIPSAPPPSPPSSPPPPPPSIASPPPIPGVSPPPPQTDPPVTTPPASSPPPPAPPLSAPPTSAPPPPSPPPPPSAASSPPKSSPTPPSSDPPNHSPPSPPSSDPPPPKSSPPPPLSKPPENSPPSPPSPPSQAPRSSPSPPASPPTLTPVTPTPVSPSSSGSPPSPVSQTTDPSSPSLPAKNSSFDTSQIANSLNNGGNGTGRAVAIGVVTGLLVLGIIGLVALWIFKRKKRTSGANGGYIIPASGASSPRSDIKLLVKTEHPAPVFGGGSGTDTPSDHGGFGNSRSWFTYQELLEATDGFSDQNLLGEGGFGCVYKGILVDGREVAVKQLKIGGGQGEREFKAEVEIISRIHHRHLVSLVGYCIWESRRLLVYEYVPNDTLHFHLHGVDGPVMDWAKRVKIAAGAARGIAYLHEDCHPRIIHRDIKSSNILLDNNFEARVSDFGLAKLAMDAETHVSTRVMGTFGYLAPEYATSGKLTEKSDVYSFGVVLLELITGRKPVDESQPLGDESLVEWARPLLTHALDTGEFGGLVDPRLEKNYNESEMFRMIEAAAACVRHSASKRPKMGQVVRAFDSVSDSGDLSNGLRVGESQLYDSAQQSAEIRWFRKMAFGSQDDITTTDFIQPSQNLGFSNQTRPNVNFSALHELDREVPTQHSHVTHRSTQYHSTQRTQNLNFSREDSHNR